MSNMQHSTKQLITYRACRRGLNNWDKAKDRTASKPKKNRKRK